MKKMVFLFLISIVLVSACTQKTVYVCDGGREVSDPYLCDNPEEAQKISGYCGNGVCENDEDSSNCCVDCSCPIGFSCDGTNCKKLAECGNGVTEEGETSENCCMDAGCSTGETCQENSCVVLKPELKATFLTDDFYSATQLKASGLRIGEIRLDNIGNDIAKDIKVTFSSPNGYFSDKTISFMNLNPSMGDPEPIDLVFLDKVLDVTTDEQVSIKTDITYSNSANNQYSSEESFNINIMGRNFMTWAESKMIALWVTPTQPVIREFATKSTAGLPAGMGNSNTLTQKMAARWLFESMQAYGIKYVNDAHSSADYIQFPYETLKNKAGDCDDLAVLYSSLLESIGLESFLVLVPGHIFSGYINSEGYAVPIETTVSDFDYALSSGITQYNDYKDSGDITVMKPTESWGTYPSVNLPEKEQLGMPSITKQMSKCELGFSWEDFFIATSEVTFVNSGTAPGAGCAALAVTCPGGDKDEDIACWVINPGETKTVTYSADTHFLESCSCSGI